MRRDGCRPREAHSGYTRDFGDFQVSIRRSAQNWRAAARRTSRCEPTAPRPPRRPRHDHSSPVRIEEGTVSCKTDVPGKELKPDTRFTRVYEGLYAQRGQASLSELVTLPSTEMASSDTTVSGTTSSTGAVLASSCTEEDSGDLPRVNKSSAPAESDTKGGEVYWKPSGLVT